MRHFRNTLIAVVCCFAILFFIGSVNSTSSGCYSDEDVLARAREGETRLRGTHSDYHGVAIKVEIAAIHVSGGKLCSEAGSEARLISQSAFVSPPTQTGFADSLSGNNRSSAATPPVPSVKLKTGANLRSGPSRESAVVRVLRVDEVFADFGSDHGWRHVGRTSPEGWIAESVIAK